MWGVMTKKGSIEQMVVFVSGICLQVLEKRSKRLALRKPHFTIHDHQTQEVRSSCERTTLRGICGGEDSALYSSLLKASISPPEPHSRSSERDEVVTTLQGVGHKATVISDERGRGGSGRGRSRIGVVNEAGQGERTVGTVGSVSEAARKKSATIPVFVADLIGRRNSCC